MLASHAPLLLDGGTGTSTLIFDGSTQATSINATLLEPGANPTLSGFGPIGVSQFTNFTETDLKLGLATDSLLMDYSSTGTVNPNGTVNVFATGGDDMITIEQIGPGGGTIHGDSGHVTVDVVVPGYPRTSTQNLVNLQLSKVANLIVDNTANAVAVNWTMENGEIAGQENGVIRTCFRLMARRAC